MPPKIPAPYNPLEHTGLSSELIGALLQNASGAPGIQRVLARLQRAVARELHPDVLARNPGDQDDYKTFADAIAEARELTHEELAIVAAAYATRGNRSKRQTGAPRTGGQYERVAPEFVRDGTLVRSIADMYNHEGVHVPSMSSRTLLVRSVGGARSAFGVEYNGGQFFEVRSCEDGLRYTEYTSEPLLGSHPVSTQKLRDGAEKQEALAGISARFCGALAEEIALGNDNEEVFNAVLSSRTDADTLKDSLGRLLVVKKEGPSHRFYYDGLSIGSVESGKLTPGFSDGWYILMDNEQAASKGNGPRYVFQDRFFCDAERRGDTVGSFVIGSSASPFMVEEAKRSASGSSRGRSILSIRGGRREGIPVHEVPDHMLPRLEAHYGPQLPTGNDLLAVNKDGSIGVLGRIAQSLEEYCD